MNGPAQQVGWDIDELVAAGSPVFDYSDPAIGRHGVIRWGSRIA